MPLMAFAQLDDNTLTVTASRAVNPQPDQVVINVYVNTGPSGTLDDAVKIVSSVGITPDNFVGVFDVGTWGFQLIVPFDQMKATLAKFKQFRQDVLNYTVYSQISDKAQKALCAYPALMSDAQAQVQRMASVAGVKVGAVVAISDNIASVPVLRQGDFSVVIYDPFTSIAPYWFGSSGSTTLPVTCSMTVQFQLVQ